MELTLNQTEPSHRKPLTSSFLAQLPFQLLPYAQHEAQNLERLLSWQSDYSKELDDDPFLSFITWAETEEEFLNLQILIESLAIQSSQAFEISIILAKQVSKQFTQEFLHNTQANCRVKIFSTDIANRCSLYEIIATAFSPYVLIISPANLLHPSAVFILRKKLSSKLAGVDAVLLNELLIQNGSNTSLSLKGFWRKSHPDFFSVLCYNFYGEGLLISKATCIKLKDHLENLNLEQWRNGTGHWILAMRLFQINAKIAHIPLALFLKRIEQQASLLPLDPILKTSAIEIATAKELPFVDFVEAHLADNTLGRILRPELNSDNAIGDIQVIIPFRDQSSLTCNCLQSLAYQNISNDIFVTLVDNNSKAEESEIVLKYAKGLFHDRCHVLRNSTYFNFARLNNCGTDCDPSLYNNAKSTKYILFLNNDVELQDENTLLKLRQWSSLENVGIVGPQLIYPNGDIQSSGIVFAAIGPANIMSNFQFASVTREVDSVSLACAMMRRDIFYSVGKLDENFCPNGFGDALLGLRIHEIGLKAVLCSEIIAIHKESKSRSSLPEELERLELEQMGIKIPVLHDDFEAYRHSFIVNYSNSTSPRVINLGRKILNNRITRKILNKIFG